MTISNPNDGLPVVIFGAKSTDDPHGSIPAQIADCRDAIEREGGRVLIADPFDDEAASAFKGNRGEGLTQAKEAAIAAARRYGTAELWVQHTDRIARGDGITADHFAEVWFALRKHRVRLRSVQDDHNTEDAIRAVLIGERNHEDSKRKSDAVRRGKRTRFENGDSTGPLHDGYMRVVRTNADGSPVTTSSRNPLPIYDRVPDPERAPLIVRIFAMFDEGQSPGDIARTLNAEGLRTRRGKHWTARRIRSTVTNPYYAGWVGTGCGKDKPPTELHDGNHAQLIDRELFARIQAKVTRMDPIAIRARQGGRPPADDYLLKGVATCARCGTGMYTRRYAETGRTYLCGSVREARGTCDLPRIPAGTVEAAVLRHLDRFGESLRDFLAHHVADHGAQRDTLAVEVERRQEALTTLDRRLAKYTALADEAADDDGDLRAAMRAVARVETERDDAMSALADATAALEEFSAPPDVDGAVAAFERLRALIAERVGQAEGMAALNAFMRELVASCMVEVDAEGAYLTFTMRHPMPNGYGANILSLGMPGGRLDEPGELPAWLGPINLTPDGDAEITEPVTFVYVHPVTSQICS